MIIRKHHNKTAILGLIIIFLFGFALSAHAATVTWTGNGTDNLASNSANWSGNTIPQYGDDVIFDNTSKDCTWDLNVSLASLSIKSGYTGKVTKATGVSLTIAANFVPPSPPSGLTATAISSSQINLSWTDNSNNETGFKIERKTGAGGTYSQIAVVGANVTTYSDTGLTAGTTYYYKVRAYNSFGDSAYSNEANALVGASPTATTEPATIITNNSATLNATVNPNGLDTTFYFEWGTSTSYNKSTPLQPIGNGMGDVSIKDYITGLSQSTTYYYRVVASNFKGTTYGNDRSFTTSAGPPVISVVPSSLDFGSVGVGSSSSLSFTVSNSGLGDLQIGTISGLLAPFSITSDGCSGQVLSASASCLVTVKFNPTTGGTFTNSITIPSNDIANPIITLTLSGVGTTATLKGMVFESIFDSNRIYLPGVTVTITDALNNRYVTTTDPTGAYNVTGLAQGNFSATFEKIGYIKQTVNGTLSSEQTLTLDVQLIPNLSFEIIRPTDAYNPEGWINPSYGFDNDAGTYTYKQDINITPSISFGGSSSNESINAWQSKSNYWNTAWLYVTVQQDQYWTGDDYVEIVVTDKYGNLKHTIFASPPDVAPDVTLNYSPLSRQKNGLFKVDKFISLSVNS